MPIKRSPYAPLVLIAFMLMSCSLPFAASSGAVPTSAPSSPAADTPTAMPAAPTDSPAPADTLAPATPAGVTITVTNESLNIRRGPSVYYDALSYLKAGQSATAAGRNTQGNWLYVPLPGMPASFGWISTDPQYATTAGDINSLPVQAADPAKPAYIRNCTFHPMLIKPGNVLLQPQTDKTKRIAHFAPGMYNAYDQNVSNKNVFTVQLHEGDSVDIKTDGLGNTYTCP